jgi:hypothetical protein
VAQRYLCRGQKKWSSCRFSGLPNDDLIAER